MEKEEPAIRNNKQSSCCSLRMADYHLDCREAESRAGGQRSTKKTFEGFFHDSQKCEARSWSLDEAPAG